MRETTINPAAGGSVSAPIQLVRDERRRLILAGMTAASLVLTISATPGGAPLIELPGTGQFDIAPVAVQALAEGWSYPYNIWQREAGGDLVLIATGQLTMGESIAPALVDSATTFLAGFGQAGGPSQIVTLTEAAWAALAIKDQDTIYIIRGIA